MAPNDSAAVPMIKAAGVNSMIEVLASLAPDRFRAWVGTLPPATADLIHRRRNPQSWVPLEALNPLYTLSLDGLFDGNIERLFELGRLQLRNDLSGIYRVFLRVASPGFVADRSAAIYAVYGQDCGTLKVVDRTEHSLDVLIDQRPLPSAAVFEYLRGSIFGAIELTSVKDLAVVMVPQNPETADRRLFHVSWR